MQSASGWRAVQGDMWQLLEPHSGAGGTAGVSPVIAAMPARGRAAPLPQVPVPLPSPAQGMGAQPRSLSRVPAAEGQRQGQPSSSISSFSCPGWQPRLFWKGDLHPLPVPGLRHSGDNSALGGERRKEESKRAASLVSLTLSLAVISSQPGQD